MKKQLSIILMTLLLMLTGYFGLQAFSHAKKYEAGALKLVMDQNIHNQAEYQLKSIAEDLSLGYFQNEKRIEREKIVRENTLHQEVSVRYTRYAVGMAGIVLLVGYFFGGLRSLVLFGGMAAAMLLLFGIFTPLLTVTVHKEVEYLGDVVLSFESKSVLGSIAKLWGSGEVIVALVILLFSVLVPIAKIVSLVFVSIVMNNRLAHGIVQFFKMIGKWSMVDVFVVATLLVYLTGRNSDVSHAEIQTGLYFFLAYVIVSMVLSFAADTMLKTYKELNGKPH